jgi:predicted nucleotidyltransferase
MFSTTINYLNVEIITTIVEKMATLLKPSIKSILSLFHKNNNVPIHLREISRRIGLEGQGITRYLNMLEKDKVLISKKDGNLKKYSLRNNNSVYSLLSLFDIEKYNKLPVIRRQAIELFIDSLKEQPIVVFLFGSTAKESFNDDSDIDILLIVNSRINVENALREVDAQTAQKISIFQITWNHFKKELKLKDDKVVQSALETGYPLTNHVLFYRWVKNETICFKSVYG